MNPPEIKIIGAAASGKSALAFTIKSALEAAGIAVEIIGEDEVPSAVEKTLAERVTPLKGQVVKVTMLQSIREVAEFTTARLTVESLKAHLVEKATKLLQENGRSITFRGEIVTVVDPEIESDMGSNQVGIDQLLIGEDNNVLALGDFYEDGSWLEESDPIELAALTCEEIEGLLTAATRTVSKATT